MARMPGAILMTRLTVYDTKTPDGQIGGTPHVHLACSEMYVILGGDGALEIIDNNGFSRVDFKPQDALLFTPGTIHRLINPNGDVEILVLMQNSGLPERGDNVVCFTDDWLSSDSAYQEAMRIESIEDAYRRRDRGVEGFLALKAAFNSSMDAGRAALRRFYELAEERTAAQHVEWREMIEQGALLEAQNSLAQLDMLQNGDLSYLQGSELHVITGNDSTPGFCGHLNRYFDPISLLPEGIRQT